MAGELSLRDEREYDRSRALDGTHLRPVFPDGRKFSLSFEERMLVLRFRKERRT